MYQTEKIIRKIERFNMIVAMRDDGLVHVAYLPNTEITIELQNEMVKMYEEITEGKKARFIFEGGEFVSITKDARENAILMEDSTPTLSSAIVVQNLGQKIIADFYYMVNKPKQPYKVFWSFEKGVEWLQSLNLTD
jgi:hypothetical protein